MVGNLGRRKEKLRATKEKEEKKFERREEGLRKVTAEGKRRKLRRERRIWGSKGERERDCGKQEKQEGN